MSDETILALHRRIAALDLEIARLKRHNEELRSAIEALMAPAPPRSDKFFDSNSDPLPPYGR
jgi:hypothetical protein